MRVPNGLRIPPDGLVHVGGSADRGGLVYFLFLFR